jgi:hypothetical protein
VASEVLMFSWGHGRSTVHIWVAQSLVYLNEPV